MDVSVIYVTYNCSRLAIESIESVIAKTHNLTYEIIVTDNNSDTREKAILSEYCTAKKINLLKSEKNLGFGRANNMGAKYANGKYLFFLNPDTILINNAIEELFNFAEKEKITTCGGNLFSNNDKPIHSYWMIYPSISAEISTLFSDIPLKLKYRGSHEHNHTSAPREVAYITGADLMVRRDLFNNLNGFDNDFFLYFEETELEYRIKSLGNKIYNVPTAKIIHLESQTMESKERKMELFYKSRKLFFEKTHKNSSYIAANVILIINCYIRLIFFYISMDKEKIKFWRTTLKQIL